MGDRFANGDTGNDTGGLADDRLVTGFDPTSKGFYNGGDLKGLTSKLDYIQGLGTDAIWLTPIFKNKAVQLEDGPSAGYHGYWITDFTQVDPHLGTNQDLADLVDAAHAARDEGLLRHHHQPHRRRDRLRGGRPDGVRLEGRQRPTSTAGGQPFDDRDYAGTNASRPSTRRPRSPTTPCSTPAEQDLKVPAWLNDVDDVPQPRQHDLHRRGQPVRRLLRPRRPLHREARRSSTG